LIGGVAPRREVRRENRLQWPDSSAVLKYKLVAFLAALMQEQHRLRIGALDGEWETVVGSEFVDGSMRNLGAMEAVGRFERQKLDRGAAVGGHIHLLAFEHFAVQNQRSSRFAPGSSGIPANATACTRTFFGS
jgi:hypothetical protein